MIWCGDCQTPRINLQTRLIFRRYSINQVGAHKCTDAHILALPNPHQPIDTLVNDQTLDYLTRQRPMDPAQMRLVSGMSEAALAAFQDPLLSVITTFMPTAKHLKTETDWTTLERMRR